MHLLFSQRLLDPRVYSVMFLYFIQLYDNLGQRGISLMFDIASLRRRYFYNFLQ